MKEKFARWDVLFLLYLKRDWKKIIFWIIGLSLFGSAYVPAFEEMSKGNGLIAMFETMKNPAMISMVGPTPIKIATDYTIGAMYAHEMLLFCGVFAMIISALHVVGHTRKEEDLGLTELVRSFQVGRQSNSVAVLLETILINLALAILISIIMIGFGVDSITVEGSLLYGASIGMGGIIGAVIALVFSQIMSTSSGASGSSLSIIGLLYIMRAGTDVSNIDFSMFNPLGWIYLTFPFTNNNASILVLALAFVFIMVILSFALEGGRDMGAGYIPEREGRASAKQSLLSVPGLFIRLNRGVIIGWLVSFVILGAAYGSIYGDMKTFLESNEMMKQMFTLTGVALEESFTSTIMMVMILMVAILPIAIVNKLHSEEVRRHLSQLYSTKITRNQLYWTSMLLANIIGVVGILLSSLGLGQTAILAMGENSTMDILTFLAAGFNSLPSVLFFAGLAGLVLGWAPKLGKVAYVYLGYSFAINYFGGIVKMPEWFSKTALQSFIPRMPVEDFDIIIFTVITVISILLMVLGGVGYNRRDMIEGD